MVRQYFSHYRLSSVLSAQPSVNTLITPTLQLVLVDENQNFHSSRILANRFFNS